MDEKKVPPYSCVPPFPPSNVFFSLSTLFPFCENKTNLKLFFFLMNFVSKYYSNNEEQ